jgi:threonine/homoserine/homoserine lactone efflux protein
MNFHGVRLRRHRPLTSVLVSAAPVITLTKVCVFSPQFLSVPELFEKNRLIEDLRYGYAIAFDRKRAMSLLGAQQFLSFLGLAVLITLSPGPDNLMVLSLGASRGRQRGMAFGLGCAAGCLSHTFLAAIGVSALIAASPIAFTALKILGGLYLIRMGWQALRSRGGTQVRSAQNAETAWVLFRKGVIANAINPKVVMFFLAFLPQFVVVSRGDAPWQIVQLGVVFSLQGALLFGTLGYFAGHIGQWLNSHGNAGKWLDRIAGTIFVGLGLKLIVSR